MKRLVTTAPAIPRPRSADACLPDMLWAQVRAQPHATAVVYEDESLTFAELAREAARLSAYLQHLGVAPDDCVGMFVDPSITLMVGAWGILLAGGAYLPLSPEYPDDRLRYMIENSGATVLLAQAELARRLTDLAKPGTKIVTATETSSFSGEYTPSGLRPGHLAYVIFTSGSTGKPKGVMIEQRSIVSQLRWLTDEYAIDRTSVVLQKTPMSFDAAQWEILGLACGARVVMGAPGIYRDPERIIEAVNRHDVTVLQCVPTLLQALVDTEELNSCKSLTQIFSGGEALSRTLAREVLAQLPGCDLVNLYGPTECTINSSACTVDPSALDDGPQTVSIGRPVRDTQYYILDEHRAPVAVGKLGELYIGGVQLARGYLHRPELTAERFIDNPFLPCTRLYRTGDLAYWNADGTAQFAGRADNQVKLRGFRVELDEIRLAIETHDWVKCAAVVVRPDTRTGLQNLVAFVELNPKEAALMDQGNAGAHHQSKESKLQIKAQLANMGCREPAELEGLPEVELPGRTETLEQRREVFARKTYRFFEGGAISAADIVRLLDRRIDAAAPRRLEELSLGVLGEILRYFGQFHSGERLLPKYGYASPGALYATQMYLELSGIAGLDPGIYYYHPACHTLVLISAGVGGVDTRLRVHFMGKKRAIAPVYTNNIQEVLEIETGHMIGLFEEVLPRYGLVITAHEYGPGVRERLGCADEDFYLGTFAIEAYAPPPEDQVDVYVQTHPGRVEDLPAGHYRYANRRLHRISDELIQRRHVIAINQSVYERSSLGITVISRNEREWLRYIDLGRKLHHLQANRDGVGFMSSGYSSKTGNPLPSARRMEAILGRPAGPSYFFVGGPVSDEQVRGEGMLEDAVHMKGPAELIKEDLMTFLPDYMMPNRVRVLAAMPLTANGKIDFRALEGLAGEVEQRLFVAPRTPTEQAVAQLWAREMRLDKVSIRDEFFASGGNSLIAVGLINKINQRFGKRLPLQVIFESSTVEKLAARIDGGAAPISRLILLNAGAGRPIYCWPGLGGYPMNLRRLAGALGTDRPFCGVQAYGINEGETPHRSIREMAAHDVEAIRRVQPEGPYTLWGYSFGARVAFETAYQLERAGERVEDLVLLAPGAPRVGALDGYAAYLTILYSVFAGAIAGPQLDECLRVASDEDTVAEFISANVVDLDLGLIRRVMAVVRQTYEFKYAFHELAERSLAAPVTIVKATGDDYSFIENSSGYAAQPPVVVELAASHYSMLKDPGVDELVTVLRRHLA